MVALFADGEVPWRTPDAYDYLHHVERTAFAWEWLRRTKRYHESWTMRDSGSAHFRDLAARKVGLASLIDPVLRADTARPIWLERMDRRVVAADATSDAAPRCELFDIRRFQGRAEVAVDEQGVELWRLGDATQSVRLDVISGTLLGAPTLLAYRLSGMCRVLPKLVVVALLAQDLSASGPLFGSWRDTPRRARWILELRVADALSERASQQEIARVLFGAAVSARHWRQGDESYRLRVQRLARAARARLADPTSPTWFGS